MVYSDGSPAKFGYSVVENINFNSAAKFNRYTFTITGVISAVGSDVGMAIKVTDDLGATGGTKIMSFSGIAISTQVGSVGTL